MGKNDKQGTMIHILQLIKQSGIPVGSIYLADKMDAASATIGRILIDLENQGLIRKVGVKGRILTAKGEEYLAHNMQWQFLQDTANELANLHVNLSRKTLLDIMDLRMLLEPYAAEMACLNGTEEQMQLLEQSVLEYKLEVSRGDMGDRPGMQMHLFLAEMSGNALLKKICTLLLAQTHAHNMFSQIVEKRKVLDIQVAEHEMIAAAVKARDAQTARNLLYEHIASSRCYLSAEIPE